MERTLISIVHQENGVVELQAYNSNTEVKALCSSDNLIFNILKIELLFKMKLLKKYFINRN